MNQKIKHLIIFLFSLVLLLATPFILRRADNKEQLKNLPLGYPLAFVVQDSSYNIKTFAYFPNWDKLRPFDKNYHINRILWSRMLFSFLLIFFVLEATIFILEIIDFKIRKHFFPEQEYS